ncbi:MAG: hypothetical protein JWQ71_4531 [Pedosphaera sp.]|nr:hypothetical protein [Pedosphaera sp.]
MRDNLVVDLISQRRTARPERELEAVAMANASGYKVASDARVFPLFCDSGFFIAGLGYWMDFP